MRLKGKIALKLAALLELDLVRQSVFWQKDRPFISRGEESKNCRKPLLTLCGDTVILYDGLLAAACSPYQRVRRQGSRGLHHGNAAESLKYQGLKAYERINSR